MSRTKFYINHSNVRSIVSVACTPCTLGWYLSYVLHYAGIHLFYVSVKCVVKTNEAMDEKLVKLHQYYLFI